MNWNDALEDISGDVVQLVKENPDNFKSGWFSSELKKQRYPICKSCEEFDSSWKKCNQCGCFMPIKSLMSKETCPLGKW